MSFGDSIRGLVEDGIPWGFLTAAAIVLVLTPLVARVAPRIGGARMTMLQAGSYGGALHWLKAVAALDAAARPSGRAA